MGRREFNTKVIQETFPQLQFHTWDASYMVQRAILTPKNEDVEILNNMIINHFLGEQHNLLCHIIYTNKST